MKFEDALESSDCSKVMHSVCYRYNKKLHKDDAKSLKLQTLWECCQKYDPNHPKKTKFTSFLYQQLDYKIKNLLKKYKKEKTNVAYQNPIYLESNLEFEILESLREEEKNILKQYYLKNMTMEEIGKANGYSRETARRRLKKVIHKCKDILNETRISMSGK